MTETSDNQGGKEGRDEAARPIRTFGRIGGRALSARQQGLVDHLLPKILHLDLEHLIFIGEGFQSSSMHTSLCRD